MLAFLNKDVIQSQKRVDLFIFISIFMVCGLFGLKYAQVLSVDFYNYQYYNAWAFLNDRINQDFMAANSRTYLNPYLDVFQYGFLKLLNSHPYCYYFLSTFDSAIALFLLYKIASFVLDLHNYKFISYLLILIYPSFSPVMLELIEPSRNDTIIAIFVLLAVYHLLKNLFEQDSLKRKKILIISGCLMGFVLAVKLSAIVYILTVILSILFLQKKIDKPFKVIKIFSLSMLVSFFVIDGYWLYVVFKSFHNPFFPYFNNIFKSPMADYIPLWNMDFNHLRPKNIFQFVFYPFMWSPWLFWGSDKLMVYDPRYALNLVSCYFILVAIFINKNFKIFNVESKYVYFIMVFCLTSYYLNVFFFGQYRYILATYLLFGLIIFITLSYIFKNKIRLIILSFILVNLLVIFVQKSDPFIRYRSLYPNTKVLDFIDYNFQDDSYVILLNFESSYSVVNQNKKAKYCGFCISDIFYSKYLKNYNIDDIYDATFFYSKYLENQLYRLFEGQNKIYVVYQNRDYAKAFNFIVFNALLHNYADTGSSRVLENCKIYFYDEHNVITKCEYNKNKKGTRW